MPDSPPVTILYVVSSPHSGSTVLSTILGSHPDIFFAGELYEIPEPAWIPGVTCSCGKPAATCDFWRPVRKRFERTADVEALHRDEGNYRNWKSLPRVLLGRTPAAADFPQYAARLETLVRSIATESGKRIIVDTSKGGTRGRAYLEAASPSLQVKVLHVVRDGRGVVLSRRNREARVVETGGYKPHATLRYSLLWVGANLSYVLLFGLRRDRYLRVRLEDFTRDPDRAFDRIARFLSIDLSGVRDQVKAGAAFPVGHVIAGNRLRLSGAVRMRPEASEWTTQLPRADQRLFAIVAGWTARLFGYS
ncbi:MAG: sulfotransferase [Thermoplasmata archaeon]|nr:sulfotransferase [Thermoplasmata archaeon]